MQNKVNTNFIRKSSIEILSIISITLLKITKDISFFNIFPITWKVYLAVENLLRRRSRRYSKLLQAQSCFFTVYPLLTETLSYKILSAMKI